MKKFFFILIFLILFILIILSFNLPKKFVSRVILSHDLSLLPISVFQNINDQIKFDMTKAENQKESLIIINNFIYNFHKPVFSNLDSGVSWKMLHGSIWCDGVADIFIRLVESINTRASIVYLYNNQGVSPHTVPFVNLNNNKNQNNTEENTTNMYLFDPQNNYYPLNKNKEYVDVEYMTKNFDQFDKYIMLISDGINNQKIFLTNRVLNNKFELYKISNFLVNIIPKKIMKNIFKFAILINPELKDDYKLFLYARLEHILLNYDDAIIRYSNIDQSNHYYIYAQFWLKRIIEKSAKLNQYHKIDFSNINNNYSDLEKWSNKNKLFKKDLLTKTED